MSSHHIRSLLIFVLGKIRIFLNVAGEILTQPGRLGQTGPFSGSTGPSVFTSLAQSNGNGTR